jgi:hypothetical protein
MQRSTAMNIVCDDGPDEKAWCDPPCDALLIERKDGSMICSYCAREYLPKSVNKHHRTLEPIENPYDTDGPILVSMNEYGSYVKKKKETILDKEEKAFVAAGKGRSIIDVEEWLPEPEGERDR